MAKGTLAGYPRSIAYIVGNEACERFSYYGMRSILVVFMTGQLLMEKHESKAVYHFFMMTNYFLPLLGGYLADRYLGKYRTVLYLSLVYCLGHGVLAMGESKAGLYAGLFLIALGAGGIKPCVAAYVGDQFTESNKKLVDHVYSIFYFSINFGAFFSSILIPWVYPRYGSGVAFGIPGILMAIATWVFWLGRRDYRNVALKEQTHFFGVLSHSLKNWGRKPIGQESWLDVAASKFGAEAVDGVKAAIGVVPVFLCFSAFWALYDQTGSSWVLQAQQMDLVFLGVTLEASQVQAINPILIMLLIPFATWVLYPGVEKMGIPVTALRKIGVGMAITCISFLMVGAIQLVLDSGTQVNVGWQFLAFLVVTMAEVMVSITGLEFAYTQAPQNMKSTIMSFFLLSVSLGNFLTGIISQLNPFDGGALEFFFYAGLMFVVGLAFIFIATRYKERSFLVAGE